MIPEAHTREIAAGLPHSQLQIFPGAGHGALLEIPEQFNAVLERFFEQAKRTQNGRD
jgi:pimeloyl-ACP methyl ester carboxylesterase